MKKTWPRVLTVVLVLVSFALTQLWTDSAEARRRKRRRREKRPKVINEKKLFERLGGRTVLDQAVEEWFRLALADTALTVRFKPLAERAPEFAKTRKQLVDELCEISDGPCPEREDSAWLQLRSTAGLDEGGMVQFVSLFSSVLQQKGVEERERNELLGRLGGIEPMSSAEAAGPASERRGGNR
ncbi:MAG: hypothetical protein JNJ49_12835 [Bdellovibrionaceae bacterium]|nr:hypothetical protein [Pseudobdellovibrionaceae bacterium]